MTDTPLHSPLPWKSLEQMNDGLPECLHYTFIEGYFFDGNINSIELTHKENADLIVEAVNSHAQLKERVEELERHLRSIENIAGNISDEKLEKGISNDATQRGIQIVSARKIARAALSNSNS